MPDSHGPAIFFAIHAEEGIVVPTAFWIVTFIAQERSYPVVLPELQYSSHCSSEISIHNTSPRSVAVELTGHRSSGALATWVNRSSNRLLLKAAEWVHLKLDVDDDAAWAEIVEIVPHPRLKPVLAVSGKTECLDGNELLTTAREIAPVVADPRFSFEYEAAALNGKILLLINASDQRMQWTACYSGGTMVSDGTGNMAPVCSESLERTMAPYQSARLAAAIDGKPLVRFRAQGGAAAMQMLTPSAPQVRLYKVESTIRFDQ